MRAVLKQLDDRLSRWWMQTPVMPNGLFVLLILATWNLSTFVSAWGDGDVDFVHWLNLAGAGAMIAWVVVRRREIRVIHLPDDPESGMLARRVIVPRDSDIKPEDML